MQNTLLSKFLIFTTGAAIGSVVTWKLLKSKYERIAQEEINSVREYYVKNEETETITDEAYGEDVDEGDYESDEREEYSTLMKRVNYSTMSENKVEKDEGEDIMIEPYVISPEEVEDSDYDCESLDYYEGDGVLTDSYGSVIENVDEMVGEDFASHFGEYEKDTVFVRNENLKTDFEICRDYRRYSEVN